MKNFKAFSIVAAVLLTLTACAEKKPKIPAKIIAEEKGKSNVEFSGVVNRKASYGNTANTRIFCTYNPKYGHYSIALLENGIKSPHHKANDGVFIELFDNPSNVTALKAKDLSTSMTVVLKESTDSKNSLFGRGDESCTVSFDTKKQNNLKGSFNCPVLSNEAGQKVGVKGSFECGSVYVWKY